MIAAERRNKNISMQLIDIEKEKEFLICVDSDGCAVNTMEYKHRNFFCPRMIQVWKLEKIADDVADIWNFKPIFQMEGISRLALIKVFK